MNISIDLGNIWDAMSAIGTFAAVILSLYLLFREKKVSSTIEIDGINTDLDKKNIEICIKNISQFKIRVKTIKYSLYIANKIKKKCVITKDFWKEKDDYPGFYIDTPLEISPYETTVFSVSKGLVWNLEIVQLISKLQTEEKSYKNKNYILEFEIRDISGYVSKKSIYLNYDELIYGLENPDR